MGMKIVQEDPEKLKRKHRKTFSFNELEQAAFDKYCKKYKVKNKSRFMREAIVKAILKKFDEDYPTLFDVEPVKVRQTSLF